MASAVTLRMYFVGVCVYADEADGTDVWFPAHARHLPVLQFPAPPKTSPGLRPGRNMSLAGWVLSIEAGGAPIAAGPTARPDEAFVPRLKKLVPTLTLPNGFDPRTPGRLPARLSALVKLAGGKLTALRAAPGRFSTATWDFPKPGGTVHTQQLTNRCSYELEVLAGPIRFVLQRGADKEWIEPPADLNGVCAVDVEMRDVVRCVDLTAAGEIGSLPGAPGARIRRAHRRGWNPGGPQRVRDPPVVFHR